ncbi:MAG: PASTA domain-containing protein [Desulfobacteraceae bacterium]|nr:PASTA domain-containing protein [Desulfobacteraceae bacterium]
MNALKNFRIIILPLAIFVIIGFALTAIGANKNVSQSKTVIKESQPTKIIPKAKTKIRVPNLVGKTELEAKKIIKKLGFKIGKIEYQKQSKGKPNTVIKQNPKAGIYAVKGSQINLLILKIKSMTQSKTILKEKYHGKKISPEARRGSKPAAPKIQKIGNDFYLIFPEAVKNVSVLGSSGKANQTSTFGKKFKITSSMEKVKGGKLIVKYTDSSGRLSTHEMMTSKYKIRTRKVGGLNLAPVNNEQGRITFIKPGPNVGYMFQGDQYEIKLKMEGQEYIPEPCYSILLYQEDTLVTDVALQKCGPTNMWLVPHATQGYNSIPVLGSNYRLKLVTLDGAITAWSGNFSILSSGPDISVSNLHVTTSNPTSLEEITVRATITNGGKTTVDSVSLELNVEATDGSTFTFPFGSCSSLAFGNHCYIQKKIKVNRGGNYSLSANVKFMLATATDTNLSNNTATGVMSVNGKPDLIICRYEKKYVQIGHYTPFNFNVKNVGDATSPQTTVRIVIPGKGTENCTVPSLIAGSENLCHTNSWMWLLPGKFWVTAEVDPENNVDERKENNNLSSIRMTLHYTKDSESDYTCPLDILAVSGYEVYEVN